MNRNAIKFIAALTMVLDHIAYHLLPHTLLINGMPSAYTILRVFGRISFILFAYMVAEGFFKTNDRKKYFLRMLIFAVIIEAALLIFSIITNDYSYLLEANAIWTLVFGLAGLFLISADKIWIRLLVIPIVFLAEYLNISYGAYGVLIILIFGLYSNPITQFLFLIGLNVLFIEMPLYGMLDLSHNSNFGGIMNIQWFSLLAFIFIFLYNGRKGKLNTKWFFYIFYPAHIAIIFGIFLCIN